MNKLEALQELETRIKEQGTITFRYVRENEEGKCQYCAVGHLMEIAGVDTKKEFVDDEFNQKVVRIVSGETEILHPVYALGFTEKELKDLQTVNDNGDNETTLHIVRLMIEEEQRREVLPKA